MSTRSLGDAVMRARLDKSGLATGLNSAKTETTQTLDQIDRRWEQTGKKIEGIGKGLTLGLTLPLTALGGLSLKAASDAEETASKFATVYRDVGDEAERAAVRMADAYGLSSRASKQLLGDTGDLLTGFGFTGEAALDMSVQVNELAVDLASFTNYAGGAEGASAALTKGLLGEREAMKSLGIAVQEADVKAQVLLNTQNGMTFASERQAKAYATLQIAQRQSGNAMGDFARTSESFANQTRILKANLDDLLVSLGEGIIPIATPIVTGLADMAAGFAGMSEETRTFILVTGLAAAGLGPLLVGFGRIVQVAPKVVAGLRAIRTAALFMGPAGLIAGGIGLVIGLGAAFLAFRRDADDATGALDDARDAIGTASDKNALAGALDDLSGNLKGDAKTAIQEYAAEVRTATGDLQEMKREAASLINEVANAPLIAERNALEAQLQGLSNLEGATNDPASAQNRLAALSEQQQELAASDSPDDRQAAVAMGHEINMLRSAIRNGEEHNGQVEYIVERRRILQSELADVNARISANLEGTGTSDDTDDGTTPPPPVVPPPGVDKPPAPVGSLARAQEDLADERERFELATTDVARAQSAERVRILEAEVEQMRSILEEADQARSRPRAALTLDEQRLAQQQGGGYVEPGAADAFQADVARRREIERNVAATSSTLGRRDPVVQQRLASQQGGALPSSRDAVLAFAREVISAGASEGVVRGLIRQEALRNDPAAQSRLAQQQGAAGQPSAAAIDAETAWRDARTAAEGAEARFDALIRQGESREARRTSTTATAQSAQQQGGPGAVQSAEAVTAFAEQVESSHALTAAGQRASDQVDALARNFARLATISADPQLQIALSRGQGGPTPTGLAAEPVLEGAFGKAAGQMSTDLTRRTRRGDGGLDEAKEIVEGQREARVEQEAAAESFRDTVMAAGAGFATDLASAIQSGDIGGAVESLVGAGGSIVSSLAGMWGPLVSAGFSIFGGLLGGLFGGGEDADETRRHERENRERRHVPTLHINFSVYQDNRYEGGPQMPQVEQAYRRQAGIVVEEFMKRTRIPQRLAKLEGGAA